VGKVPPIYVWEGDTWYNEIDGCEYTIDIPAQMFVFEEKQVPFTKKTKVMK
jgi:hypothetical protein